MGENVSKVITVNNQFDCIIPTAGKDCLLVRKTLDLIAEFLSPEIIYIITKKNFFIYFKDKTNRKIILVDEDELLDGLSFDSVRMLLSAVNYPQKMTGWYFQQFLKMGFALSKYSNKYYLSWDADTIPTKNIGFFSDSEKPYFTMKDEYNQPYFETIKLLLGIDKISKKSFISENMMFDKDLMIELIDCIEKSQRPGINWMEKILNSIPKNKINSYSEFETYGTYVSTFHPLLYLQRELCTFRNAGKFHTRLISIKNIKELSKDYDMISLEHGHNPNGLKKYISLFIKGIVMLFNKLLIRYNK